MASFASAAWQSFVSEHQGASAFTSRSSVSLVTTIASTSFNNAGWSFDG
jgi:hypothetical protein